MAPDLIPASSPVLDDNASVDRALAQQNHKKLLKSLTCGGQKKISFTYLYDMRGSLLYEQITALEEYYPFLAEEVLLQNHAHNIVDHIPPDAIVAELGCGTARKTSILLKALVERYGIARFTGIDVSGSFLEEARENLAREVPHAIVDLMQMEYLDGLRQVRAAHPDRHICILWLGSSVGNFAPSEANVFFREVLKATGSNVQILLCTDMWKDRNVLYAAYHDSQGVTEAFIKNGMRNALLALDYSASVAEVDSWKYETFVNEEHHQVEMYVRFDEGLSLPEHNVEIRPGEAVLVEVSRKFTRADIHELAAESRMHVQSAWCDRTYGAHMLVPAAEALRRCWQETDRLFNSITDWLAKPIEVRHPFCFYYGHVASFAKLKMLPKIQPSPMDITFSRGIDPLVTDPAVCHAHPDVPCEWPSEAAVRAYVEDVRALLLEAAELGSFSMRQLSICLEHEYMHDETLCYMLAQQRKAKFSITDIPGQPMPVPVQAKPTSTPNVAVPGGDVFLGVDMGPAFVWDNEGPRETAPISVRPFVLSQSPVTVAEFRRFVLEGGYTRPELWDPEDFAFFHEQKQECPATWSLGESDGDFFVHGPFQSHHWLEVAETAVYVSLAEAEAFCRSHKARVMTEAEYNRIIDVDADVSLIREGGWEWTATPFAPLKGFSPMPEYSEYSTDFFDGKHFVLKGSSPYTHVSMRRDSFRNYFQRLYPYVFAKFRLVY